MTNCTTTKYQRYNQIRQTGRIVPEGKTNPVLCTTKYAMQMTYQLMTMLNKVIGLERATTPVDRDFAGRRNNTGCKKQCVCAC